jgi:hypothetical protein
MDSSRPEQRRSFVSQKYVSFRPGWEILLALSRAGFAEVEVTELADRAEHELLEIVTRYAEAEAEVVRAFFAQTRTAEEYLDVVCRQAGREIHTAYQMTRALRTLDEIEDTADRRDLYHHLEQMTDEVRHYSLLAELAEEVAGRKLGRDQLLKYWVFAVYDPSLPRERQYNDLLPEANAALDFGKELIEHYGWEYGRSLTRLSEGGGGGAFKEATHHTADAFQVRFAEVMGKIYADEVGHGPGQVRAFAQKQIQSEAQLEEDKRWLAKFMSHHLRLRNEIYRYPLSEERLREIDSLQAEVARA